MPYNITFPLPSPNSEDENVAAPRQYAKIADETTKLKQKQKLIVHLTDVVSKQLLAHN